MPETLTPPRLILVSNRLPLIMECDAQGYQIKSSSGGLITALNTVLKGRGGLWIGWPGTTEENEQLLSATLTSCPQAQDYTFKPVLLTEQEQNDFYYGFSNEIIWPLFHDFTWHCHFKSKYWDVYQKVNQKYAQAIIDHLESRDYIWVHDYHLMLTAQFLKSRHITNPVGFFLHIPFPSPDAFLRLPWRREILEALLDFDLVGFQTLRDRSNFLHCLRIVFKRDVISRGKGQVLSVTIGKRTLKVGAFPIGIDFNEFAYHSQSPEVSKLAQKIQSDLGERKIIFGIDRLDYTKGIIERLRAFQSALQMYPELHNRVVFVQIIIPSREIITNYHELKNEVERLISEINGQFTASDWVPIHYMYRSLSRAELLAYYRSATVALITPLKDGMNLVAKEFCACRSMRPGDHPGVLILSEFAGTAFQFRSNALLVNPFDILGTAVTLKRALDMDEREAKKRIWRMRKIVKKYDIHWWVDSFLTAAIGQRLDAFPLHHEVKTWIDEILENIKAPA